MKKHVFVFLGMLILCTMVVWAQDKNDRKVKAKPVVPVYLGNSGMASGRISKKDFDRNLRLGLNAKDSMGRPHRVDGFLFTYAERNLYEDSVGNPLLLTDYLSEVCYGDSLTNFLKNNITDRSKPGDTVYFDQITLITPEGKNTPGIPMKFVLTK